MKKVISIAAMLACGVAAQAALITKTVNQAIPDLDLNGINSTATVSGAGILGPGMQLKVNLSISGADYGCNGDLYVVLAHGGDYAVLLNRVGLGVWSGGYSDNGLNISLQDDAPNGDIHFYQQKTDPSLFGPVTGLWAPDGRNIDPTISSGSSSRPAMLSSFAGDDLNGSWTLFLADVGAGGTSKLDSWSVEVVPVPEPSTLLAGFAASALMIGVFWRKRCTA